MESFSTKPEHLEALLLTIHKRLSDSPLKATRCFYTSTLLMHFAARMGFEVSRWEGSARWFSRKYVELVDQGYDFGDVSKLPPEKAQKRANALRKRGVRLLECIANEGTSEDLGGHLCLTIRNEEHAFFVDPTSYQFFRDDANPGGRIEAPTFVVLPIPLEQFGKPKDFFYREKHVAGVYEYCPVNKYRALLEKPESEQQDRDINPYRHKGIYEDIEALLRL